MTGYLTLASDQSDSYGAEQIAFRRADDDDRAALGILAALDSAPAPSGEVLIAELRDAPVAAIEIASGATIADPFQPTAHLVDRLRIRAARLREGTDSPRWVRLRARSAYRPA